MRNLKLSEISTFPSEKPEARKSHCQGVRVQISYSNVFAKRVVLECLGVLWKWHNLRSWIPKGCFPPFVSAIFQVKLWNMIHLPHLHDVACRYCFHLIWYDDIWDIVLNCRNRAPSLLKLHDIRYNRWKHPNLNHYIARLCCIPQYYSAPPKIWVRKWLGEILWLLQWMKLSSCCCSLPDPDKIYKPFQQKP